MMKNNVLKIRLVKRRKTKREENNNKYSFSLVNKDFFSMVFDGFRWFMMVYDNGGGGEKDEIKYKGIKKEF